MSLRSTMTVLALGGCALAMVGCSGSGTSLFPKFGLYFNQDAQAANLAYGEANSDDVGVMMQCERGSQQVELTEVAPGKPSDPLVLDSGSQHQVLPAKLSMDETGASLAEATLPLNAPVLQDFRRNGKIAVSLGGARYGVRARQTEKAAVSSFFSACEKS